jgi:hypothetical protein
MTNDVSDNGGPDECDCDDQDGKYDEFDEKMTKCTVYWHDMDEWKYDGSQRAI